jgi:hypothetical protein
MRALIAAIAAIACLSCQKPAAQEKPSRDPIQRVLDQIAKKCGLPPSTFKRIGKDELTLQLSPDARYESVDCALTELNKAKLPLKLGFVGNEYVPENGQ